MRFHSLGVAADDEHEDAHGHEEDAEDGLHKKTRSVG